MPKAACFLQVGGMEPYEITGEGWLVVASSKARATIQDNIGSLGIIRAVKRSIWENDQEKSLESHGWRIGRWLADESKISRSTE